jgi:hypothetical protein
LGGLRIILIAFPRTIMRVRKARGMISNLGGRMGGVPGTMMRMENLRHTLATYEEFW